MNKRLDRLERMQARDLRVEAYNAVVPPLLVAFQTVIAQVADDELRDRITRQFATLVNDIGRTYTEPEEETR